MLPRHGREVNISCDGGVGKLLCAEFTGAENSRLALERGWGGLPPVNELPEAK